MVNDSEPEIGKLSSNSSRVQYTHFCTNSIGKDMNIFLLLTFTGRLDTLATDGKQSRRTIPNLKPLSYLKL